MADEKLANLVLKLHSGTKSGKVPWEKTASDNLFQTLLSRYVVQIFQVSDRNSEDPDYAVRILNEDAQVIDEVLNGELTHAECFRGKNAYGIMQSIFNMARRSAFGGDKAIDDIISQLE